MPTHTRALLDEMVKLSNCKSGRDSESLNKLVNHAISLFVSEIEKVESADDLIKAQELINSKIEAYLKQSHIMNLKLAKLLKNKE